MPFIQRLVQNLRKEDFKEGLVCFALNLSFDCPIFMGYPIRPRPMMPITQIPNLLPPDDFIEQGFILDHYRKLMYACGDR